MFQVVTQQFLPKSYQIWWKFDEVLTKINLHSFF